MKLVVALTMLMKTEDIVLFMMMTTMMMPPLKGANLIMLSVYGDVHQKDI